MNTYRRILTFVFPHWKHLIVAIVCSLLYSGLHGASVYLSIPLLDTLFQQEDSPAKAITQNHVTKNSESLIPDWISEMVADVSDSFNRYIFEGDTSDILLKICILIIIAFLGKSLFGYLEAYYLAYVQQGIIKSFRDKTYIHLHKLPMSYFKNERTGDLISRITNDVALIQNSFSAVFNSVFREPITIIVFMVIAVSISWKLFLVSLIILPVSVAIIGTIGVKLRKQTLRLQRQIGNITAVLQETITGVKIVKAFGMENYENQKFMSITKKYFKLALRKTRIQNISSPFTEFVAVLVGVVIIYYGGLLVLVEKSIKASEFLGFLFAIFQMIPPMKVMATVNNKIQESIAAGDRVFELLDTEPTIKNIKNPQSIKEFTSDIKFENVSFKYDGTDEIVLDNISVTVKKGEIIALVGSSGAGKTTFVDLIPRFYDPTSGKITIDGIDIKNYDIADLRKLMGIVTQETVLFNETVAKNIAYGLDNYPIDLIEEVAKIANAHNFITELPNGYNTIIGEQGTKLSGGQRQRLSISRALLKNPPVMIFDEATSALDNESEMLVQEAIERLMKERTTFVIAHRLSTIRNADRILVLDKGKIVQQGKHDELLKDEDGIYSKLYALQFRNLSP
ncbi:MAG: ABC transporter ATP-binding protein [Ignavibacteriales bacterium]|nr:ABC transporter ATP-binding protein [Ignavibacteriales bacterium]